MKRRGIAAVLTLGLLFPTSAFAANIESDIILNGEKQIYNTVNMLDSTIYFPLRVMAEELGYSIVWDGDTQEVCVQQGEWNNEISIAKEQYRINGQTVALKAPPRSFNGKTYVPKEYIQQVLGIMVGEDIHDAYVINQIPTLVANVENIKSVGEKFTITLLESRYGGVSSDHSYTYDYYIELLDGEQSPLQEIGKIYVEDKEVSSRGYTTWSFDSGLTGKVKLVFSTDGRASDGAGRNQVEYILTIVPEE